VEFGRTVRPFNIGSFDGGYHLNVLNLYILIFHIEVYQCQSQGF
jgi:hypothetical protein